jgi:DNA-directed RNA polymerase specialized sigma subunit
VSKPQDEAVAIRILQTLTETDRKAIDWYYNERRSEADIERELGLRAGHVSQLKASVRSRYFEQESQDRLRLSSLQSALVT